MAGLGRSSSGRRPVDSLGPSAVVVRHEIRGRGRPGAGRGGPGGGRAARTRGTRSAPVGPVGEVVVGIGGPVGHTGRVGHHGRREFTTDTGSRWGPTTVASGKVVSSGPSCSRCCGELRTQRSPGPHHCQDLEDGFQVAVVRRLVVLQVIVAPTGNTGDPLQLVAREVGQLKLELLVNVVGPHGCLDTKREASPPCPASPPRPVGRRGSEPYRKRRRRSGTGS